MKFYTCLTLWATGLSLAAHAGIIYTEGPYTSGFANSGYIPDGSTAGWSDTRNISDVPSGSTLSGVSVTLSINGGYNGDLYAYLSHNGQLLVLLNRVGTGTGSDPTFTFGYSNPGFNNVTLTDSGSLNIHNYGGTGVPTGPYQPDSGGVSFASTFGGGNANGGWTLFVSDLSSGGGQSQLTSWSLGLDVSAVPEPANEALLLFGGLASVGLLWRHWRDRKLRRASEANPK